MHYVYCIIVLQLCVLYYMNMLLPGSDSSINQFVYRNHRYTISNRELDTVLWYETPPLNYATDELLCRADLDGPSLTHPISMYYVSTPAQGKIASFARRVTRSCAKADKKQCGILAWHGINLWEPTLAVRQ